ncbi:MAG: MarR family transcriptional regulator [Phycisphaerales bacterium]
MIASPHARGPRTAQPAPTAPFRNDNAFRGILRAYGLLTRHTREHLATHGVTGPQWGVLRTLQRAGDEGRPGLTMKELGERLLVKPPSITMLVRRMRTDRLVHVVAARDDRRIRVVTLASAGGRLLRRAAPKHMARIDELMSGLAREEQVQLARLLQRLNSHLSGLAARPQLGDGGRGNGGTHR